MLLIMNTKSFYRENFVGLMRFGFWTEFKEILIPI